MAENREQIIRTEYSEIMQKSYIDYAMSVIIARALPDVRDGFCLFIAPTLLSQKILQLFPRPENPHIYNFWCHAKQIGNLPI